MSKDMKGMLGFADRGGWNGGVGSRRCCAAVPGFPPEGNTTGGTLNSFAMIGYLQIRVSRSESMYMYKIIGNFRQESGNLGQKHWENRREFNRSMDFESELSEREIETGFEV